MKKSILMKKMMSVLMVLCMMVPIAAQPVASLVSEVISAIESRTSLNAMVSETGDHYTSVDDITLPTVTENPYNVNVFSSVYPVYTSEIYEKLYEAGLVTGYGTWETEEKGRSPYYTATLNPWYYWCFDADTAVETNLPYREMMNDRQMQLGDTTFNAETSITDGVAHVQAYNRFVIGSFAYEQIKNRLETQFWDRPFLNNDQVYLRAGATLLSGNGMIMKSTTDGDETNYYVSQRAKDGPVEVVLDSKLSEYDIWENPYFRVYNGTMTDMYYALIDDTSPSVKDVTVEMDKEAQSLEMKITFNEGVRWIEDSAKYYLDDIWVDVELKDLRTGKNSTLRMYIAELGGGAAQNQLIFRGALGDYIYKDFRVERVIEADFGGKSGGSSGWMAIWDADIGVVDMVDAMYTSAYDGAYYGSRIQTLNEISYVTTAICDFAGNKINASSLTNWKFGNTFINNTFEAIDVKVYNNITAGKIGEDPGPATDWPENIDRTHLFSGPNNELTVHVFVDRQLTEEEAKKVSIQLNINHKDGTPLTANCTSSYTFVPTPEVYADYSSETITCLIFEGIELEEGMTMNIKDNAIPQIAVTTMTDTIEDKDAWYQVIAPTRQMYGDFDAPTVAVTRKSPDPKTPTDGYYTMTAEIVIEEIMETQQYFAGIQGSMADISLSGGVLRPMTIQYAITQTAGTPKNDEYLEATIPLNGSVLLATKPLVNQRQVYYLHLIIPSGSVMIDDLGVAVRATDLVGNVSVFKPAIEVPYQLDEVAPLAEFMGEKFKPKFNDDTQAVDITAEITVNVSDYNSVASVLYWWADNDAVPNDETVWQAQQITPDGTVTVDITKKYENVTEDKQEVLWVKAFDHNGNESEPIRHLVSISTAKPSTNSSVSSDLTVPNSHPLITVIGPDASIEEPPVNAYTRVTVTPINSNETWEYVTVVGTGETVDLFSFVGQQWYKVSRNDQNQYNSVVTIPVINDVSDVAIGHLFYDLFVYYGDLKVSFENGFESMTPVAGEYVYASARAGSYSADQNYYTVAYSSCSSELLDQVHDVDFGKIVDGENVVRTEIANEGNDAILYNATARATNPMQNTQIHFSISNILRSDWGVMDINFDHSYMELHYVAKNDVDTVVVKEDGLAGADAQYFSIPAKTDNGENFTTGMYYLVVYVKSHSGRTDTYRSSNLVLDADTVENDGLWQYSYQTNYNISGEYNFENKKAATDTPFASMGLSISVPGEVMRSNVFAVYSSGVSGYNLTLRTDQIAKEFDGFTVGMVEGFRIWNMQSEPTDEQISAQPFSIVGTTNDASKTMASYSITQGVDNIYSADTLPKGADAFEELYLMKGVNTICYQVKMANGYISPVRQFTIIVTDYIPTLNMAIENYTPSHNVSTNDAVVNVHDLTLFVESAYSLNGTGNVDVEIWGRYDMAVNGTMAIDPNHDLVVNHLEKLEWETGEVVNLKVDDTVVLTENTYTSEFPVEIASVCTAVFVAIDEYGGVTVVAPQIGNHVRYGNSDGKWADFEFQGNTFEVVEGNFDIDWDGGYHDDPYVVGRNLTELRTFYNEPKLFGNTLLGFENIFNYENGEDQVVMTSLPDLEYNQFNICTNNVTFGAPTNTYGRFDATVGIRYENGTNFDLINWDCAKVTFSGGDLTEAVTVALAGGETNDAGYIHGGYADSVFSFTVANPWAPSSDLIGKEVTRSFTITGYNIYGDPFEKTGTITLKYLDPDDLVNGDSLTDYQIENMGALVYLNFYTVECGSTIKTGVFGGGTYTTTLTDYYGNVREVTHTISDTSAVDSGTKIEYFNGTEKMPYIENVVAPLTIVISREDGKNVFVDITDYAVMRVENNNSTAVTVTLTENLTFSYRYLLDNGTEQMVIVKVDNIVEPAPRIVWNYDADDLREDEDGNYYVYGSVTAYLVDDNFALFDYTGRTPSFTFYPDAESSYVFKAEDMIAKLGDEEVTLNTDFLAALIYQDGDGSEIPFTIRERPDPLGFYDENGNRVEDRENPNIQILAYANQSGYYVNKKIALQLESARHSTAMTDYQGYTTYEYSGTRADTSKLLEALGWSSAYRFEIEISDMSRVKLFVKEGLYAEVPDFETGYSDFIDGVTLNSRLLDVSKSTKFTLFVVDKNNNYVSIPFHVTDVGAHPAPSVIKVPVSNELVRIYVKPPEGDDVTDFAISSPDLGIEEIKVTDGEYVGCWYVEYKANDDYLINYTYKYKGEPVSGTVDASVREVDNTKIGLLDLEWLENKAFTRTDREVIAVITLTENVIEVTPVGEFDDEIVSYEITGNVVKVTFEDNHGVVVLDCKADDGSVIRVELDDVTNIDRTAPILNATKVLSADGKSVVITITSNERAIFREGGYIGEVKDGLYHYYRTVTSNGTYTYHFADMGGTIAEITVTVGELVTSAITAQYSTSVNGADPVSNPADMELMIGDLIYVKPSRDVVAQFNGGEEIVLKATEWTAIEITADTGGGYPFIVLEDLYGNTLTHQFSKVAIPDGTAPEIAVSKHVYSIPVNSDRAEVEAALLANFVAFDDDQNLTLSVTFTEDLTLSGVTTVEYKAVDTAGNVGRATGKLRITTGQEPWVYVNGVQVDRDYAAIVSADEDVNLTVDVQGRSYSVLLKAGIKTNAQMKIGSTHIVSGTTSTDPISVGKLAKGYHTVCILTQDRDYFRIILYVE